MIEKGWARDAVYVDPGLIDYSLMLVRATRDPASIGLGDLKRFVSFGASPRASINLILTARALAFVRGRDYALPQDIRDLALDVIRHRLVLSYEALAENVSADDVLRRILSAVPLPQERAQERLHDNSRPVPAAALPVRGGADS